MKLRSEGFTFAKIGDALGLSREARETIGKSGHDRETNCQTHSADRALEKTDCLHVTAVKRADGNEEGYRCWNRQIARRKAELLAWAGFQRQSLSTAFLESLPLKRIVTVWPAAHSPKRERAA